MPTPDAARAYAVLDFIKAHPEYHNQDRWFERLDEDTEPDPRVSPCGSRGCYAGWTCVLNGDRIVWDEDYHSTEYVLPEDGHQDDLIYRHISARARELLGISQMQSARLFHGENTMEQLEAYIEDLFGPRP